MKSQAAFFMGKMEVAMSKIKIEKELSRIRDQLSQLKKREAELTKELKLAEDAEKQSILDKHHISAEALMEMIKAKEAEEKKLLAMSKEQGGYKPND